MVAPLDVPNEGAGLVRCTPQFGGVASFSEQVKTC
jgi:hypothetical protein